MTGDQTLNLTPREPSQRLRVLSAVVSVKIMPVPMHNAQHFLTILLGFHKNDAALQNAGVIFQELVKEGQLSHRPLVYPSELDPNVLLRHRITSPFACYGSTIDILRTTSITFVQV